MGGGGAPPPPPPAADSDEPESAPREEDMLGWWILKMVILDLARCVGRSGLRPSRGRLREYKRAASGLWCERALGCAGAISSFQIVKMSYFNTLMFIPIATIILFNKIFNVDYIKKVETTPNFTINKVLYIFFSIERFYLKYFNFPFGLSIYTLIKK